MSYRRLQLAAVLLAACAPAKPVFPAPDAIIEQRTILQLNHSRYGPAARMVIRDSVTWFALVDSLSLSDPLRATLVDFPTEMLLVAIEPRGGVSDSVVIYPVWHEHGSVRAQVTTYNNCLPAAMETVPMDAISIPRSAASVKFFNDTVRGPLCPVDHQEPFTVVLSAGNADFDSTVRNVIRDSTAWSAFVASAGKEMPPRHVDFQAQMVIAVAGKSGGTGSVRIEAIERKGNTLRVVVVRYFSCEPFPLVYTPVEAVSVPRSDSEVRFAEIEDYGPGCIEPGRRVIKR